MCLTYDPLGRRINRTEYTLTHDEWVETATDHLFYSGMQEIGQIQNGEIRQLRVLGRRDPIAIELNGKPYAPLLDVQGNIRRLIDPETQDFAAGYDYSAFGE